MSYLGPKYTPKFAEDYNKLPWYERDLMHCYDWLYYKDMKENPDISKKKKKKAVNFHILYYRTKQGVTL